MKICIVGAGAIGGLMAGWIAQRVPGAEVSLLARGATLAAVRERGLRIEARDSAPLQVPLRAEAAAAALGPQDLVIVAVKGPALAAVAPAVRQLVAPHTQVLVAMNGVPWWFFDGQPGAGLGWQLESVDPGAVVRASIPTAHVVGCVVHLASAMPAPGTVHHVMGKGLIIGDPLSPLRTNHPNTAPALADAAPQSPARIAALAALLEQSGFAVTVSPWIQRDIWFKLWGNMTMNPVSALTRATCDRVLDDPLVRGFCSAVMVEAQAIGAAFGVPIEQAPEDRHAVTRKLGAFKTSMLQDVEAGRALEVDALVGAVHEIGRRLGLATPNLDALFGLIRVLAGGLGATPAPGA